MAARLGHISLYVLMFIVSLTGWMVATTFRVPMTKDLLGLDVPPIVTTVDRSVRQSIEGSHMILAYLLAAAVLVHVTRALRHHILKRNDIHATHDLGHARVRERTPTRSCANLRRGVRCPGGVAGATDRGGISVEYGAELLRDNDGAYGQAFTGRVRAMGIRDRPISPRSPWQNPYVERLIGTLRRDCLDHVLIFGERHLRQVLTSYSVYYNPAS